MDIIEVERVEAAWKRFGDRFIRRILRPSELAYCLAQKRPGPFVAARFACKEAVSKAFGTGIGAQLGWKDIEICREESGRPFVVLHDKGRKLLDQRGARRIHLSLSHAEKHATAVALLES